jgi:hypothetical protein
MLRVTTILEELGSAVLEVAACRLRRRSVLHLDFEAERMAFRAERRLIPELQAQK